jgi:hypothetical protein
MAVNFYLQGNKASELLNHNFPQSNRFLGRRVEPLSEVEALKLFEHYREFLSRNVELYEKEDPEMNQIAGYMGTPFRNIEDCEINWKALDIRIDLSKIFIDCENTGVLQLREVDTECKTLIIGCGNSPLEDSGGYALDSFFNTSERSQEYRKNHIHPHAITINPSLSANPTLVGYFGLQKFPMLRDHQFDLIVFEGVVIRKTTDEGRNELQRLISPKAKIVIVGDRNQGYEVSWEDMATFDSKTFYKTAKVVISNLREHESFKVIERTSIVKTQLAPNLPGELSETCEIQDS